MARILLMTTAEKGHLNPMAGVALWLRRLGHAVGWLCIPEPAPALEALGVDVLRMDAPPAPPLVTGGADLARLVEDPPALRAWIRALLLDAAAGQIAPTRAVLRAWRPDVVGLDPMLYQGVIAAHEERRPYLAISSSLNPVAPDDLDCALVETARSFAADRAALFAAHGLAPEFRVVDCLSPYGTTVFSTAEYVGEAPAGVALVGPSRAPGPRGDEVAFPWERLDGRPIVLASFGSQISWQPERFAKIVAAAAPLDAQVVLSAGTLSGFPPDVVAAPYLPQRELLDRAAVMVTHGGANSAMEALSAGVPLLVSPVCNDQPIQAHFVERRGAGVALDVRTAPVADVTAALGSLLDPASPARRAAREVQASYRANDGARAVADRLVALS